MCVRCQRNSSIRMQQKIIKTHQKANLLFKQPRKMLEKKKRAYNTLTVSQSVVGGQVGSARGGGQSIVWANLCLPMFRFLFAPNSGGATASRQQTLSPPPSIMAEGRKNVNGRAETEPKEANKKREPVQNDKHWRKLRSVLVQGWWRSVCWWKFRLISFFLFRTKCKEQNSLDVPNCLLLFSYYYHRTATSPGSHCNWGWGTSMLVVHSQSACVAEETDAINDMGDSSSWATSVKKTLSGKWN